MTAVMVEITPVRTASLEKEDPDAVVLVGDVEALLNGTLPGCGDDNPYQ
ncbi:hypothetical protein [Streptomyces sp. NPDC005485]